MGSGVRIGDTRLSKLLCDGPSRQRNPVAALVVESAAASHPEHADAVRDAGNFLCELLWPAGEEGPGLTLPVVAHTFVREQHTPAETMRAHLARVAQQDLLLSLSATALLRRPADRRHPGHTTAEAEPVLRTVYLLVRMAEAQEEVDALERAVWDEQAA